MNEQNVIDFFGKKHIWEMKAPCNTLVGWIEEI